MTNTTEMFTKYVPITILRKRIQESKITRSNILSINKLSEVKEEIGKIDLYVDQCNEAIILLQVHRNKKMRLNNLPVEYELIK